MKNKYKFSLLRFEGLYQFIAFDTYFIRKTRKTHVDDGFRVCDTIEIQYQTVFDTLGVINPEKISDEVVKVRVLINYIFLWRNFNFLGLKGKRKRLSIHHITHRVKGFNVLNESIVYFYKLSDNNENLGVLREFFIDEDQISPTFLEIFCFSGKRLL